jgi:gamma-glutamylcyclotransferase (GGCT)/AIG2-like uncharacterized protein YtfP
MPKSRIYLAYGSNLNIAQMARRCPAAKQVGTAILNNYELLFRGAGRGVATVEPREGSAVPVLLWRVKPKDEAALDRYEGYPRLYGKRLLDVELNGRAVTAMLYVMTPGHDAVFPSRDYLNVIAEGYKSAGFDLGVLDAAVDRTEEIMDEEPEMSAAGPEQKYGFGQCSLFDMKGW